MAQKRNKSQRVYKNQESDLVDQRGKIVYCRPITPPFVLDHDPNQSENDLVSILSEGGFFNRYRVDYFLLERVRILKEDDTTKLVMPVSMDPRQLYASLGHDAYILQYFKGRSVRRNNKAPREELSDEVVPKKMTDAWLGYFLNEITRDYSNRQKGE